VSQDRWVAFIGGENYSRVATNPLIREAFFRVFLWNMVFAFLSVLLTFALGLTLAVVLHHYRMKGLKPEVDKINEKYKDDPQEKQKQPAMTLPVQKKPVWLKIQGLVWASRVRMLIIQG